MQSGWRRCAETAFQWAAQRGGEWLHTATMTDFELLRGGGALDARFVGAALLMAQAKGANMVAEVASPPKDMPLPIRWLRNAGSMAVGLKGCSPFCVSGLFADLSSSVVRPPLELQLRASKHVARFRRCVCTFCKRAIHRRRLSGLCSPAAIWAKQLQRNSVVCRVLASATA